MRSTDLLVLGGGPGGYTAAFRAADLGMSVTLVDDRDKLGGVCLNVGCIPSKALLHAADIKHQASQFAGKGLSFDGLTVDAPALDQWKSGKVNQLAGGLQGLTRQRGVDVIQGRGVFRSTFELDVSSADGGVETVAFRKAIIAAGSRPAWLPGLPDHPGIVDSSGALDIREFPDEMLVVGGGIIGLEMATVYAELGCRVTVAEASGALMVEADRALVKPLYERLRQRCAGLHVNTLVDQVKETATGLSAQLQGNGKALRWQGDRILIAVGRVGNGDRIQVENAGLEHEEGLILTDEMQRTSVENIYAVGDITGHPMLAHRASHQGKVAAEHAAGLATAFEPAAIPSVAYTHPEVAWVGLTEEQATREGRHVTVSEFPWMASGRAAVIDAPDGVTRFIVDAETDRLLGVGISGPHAGDLIGEACLAVELGVEPAEIALTVHPHPTLAETLGFAAEAHTGTLTELYLGP